MSYYYEKTGSYLTEFGVKRTLGSSVLTWAEDRQKEIGLFPTHRVSYSYNPYTHALSSVTWTRYDNDSDFRVDNPDAELITDRSYPAYYRTRNVVDLSDSTKEGTLINAKEVVFKETADRMSGVIGASFVREYNSLSLSDSASTLADNFSASDSDIFSLAHEINQGIYTSFPRFDQDYLASTSVVDDVIDSKLPFGATTTKMLHASWDASTAGSFNFSTDGLASYGISGVTRLDVGKFRVDFTTDFADANYTVTTGCGTTDYSGTGASPRTVSVLSRTASSVTVLCERTDDAVNEDNEYMSVMVVGLQ